MPFTIKASLFFQDTGNGWTESFFFQQPTQDLSAASGGAYATLDFLANKRAALLGADSYIKAQRVSVEVNDAGQPVLNDSFLGRVKKYGPSVMTGSPAVEINGSAKPGVGLNMTFHNTLATRRRNQFTRGIPDGLEGPSGDRNDGWLSWMSSFLSWRSAMLNPSQPCGWMGQATKTKMTITNYTQDVDNFVTFTVIAGPVTPTPTPPTPATAAFLTSQIGIPMLVNISGLNVKSTLNGSLRVVPLTTTTCRSYQPIAAVPFVSSGKMSYSTKNFIPAADISLEEIMYRSAGAPLLQPRGRKKARVRA